MFITPSLLSLDALYEVLGTSPSQYFSFTRYNKDKLYREVVINGKHGKKRIIHIPHPYIKRLQRRLLPLLEELYCAPSVANGFIKSRSIVTNAKVHKRKRQVLNLDLLDFFPSINRQRIKGLLKSSRYGLPNSTADFISYLVTYNNLLPQGAPTSPIISNMIAGPLDSKLKRLARESKSSYTRYADDLTFSTSFSNLPESLIAAAIPLTVSPTLVSVIEDGGFKINEKKTRYAGRTVRQTVTGIVVNRFPNVTRKRINDVRAILHDWSINGEESASEHFQRVKSKVGANSCSMKSYVAGQISYISMVRGSEDPVSMKLRQQYNKCVDPNLVVTKEDHIRQIKLRFEQVEKEGDRVRAGYLLEQAMEELAKAYQICVSGSFRAVGRSIQVDGHFKVGGQNYWVECKWWGKKVGTPVLQTFIGKLVASSPSNRGLVISRCGFTSDVTKFLERTHSQRGIITLDYSQIIKSIESEVDFPELIQSEWDKLCSS